MAQGYGAPYGYDAGQKRQADDPFGSHAPKRANTEQHVRGISDD